MKFKFMGHTINNGLPVEGTFDDVLSVQFIQRYLSNKGYSLSIESWNEEDKTASLMCHYKVKGSPKPLSWPVGTFSEIEDINELPTKTIEGVA